MLFLKKINSLKKEWLVVLYNYISLSFVKAIELLSQLIVVPLIIGKSGIAEFGKYSLIVVIMQYLVIIGDYGFSYLATREISIHRSNPNQIIQIIQHIFCVKLLISIPIVFLILCLYYFGIIENCSILYYIIIYYYVNLLFPSWLFQGLEKMKYLTYVKLFSRLVFLGLLLYFFSNNNKYEYVLLAESIASGFVLFFGIYFSSKLIHINELFNNINYFFNKNIFRYYFVESTKIFLSSISIGLYRNTNVIILTALSSSYHVGVYSAIEKVIRAIQAIIEPFTTALYPYLSSIFSKDSIESNINNLFKIVKLYLIPLFVLLILIYIFSHFLLSLVKVDDVSAVSQLRIMSFAILFGSLNYLLGFAGIINLGYNNKFLKYVIISGLISISFTLIFVHYINELAGSIALVLGELVLFLLLLKFLIGKK